MDQTSHPIPHDDLARIEKALHDYFGFSAFRPGQAESLAHILAHRNLLTVMPTGSGKSLIYQLAALLLPGTTLVISPLVALMKDQVDSLTRRKVAATFINSTLDLSEQNRRLQALAERQYKIVYVAPERLRNVNFRNALSRAQLAMLVVDEAHCVSQWGHDFRPDYLHIADARRDFHAPVALALTATATKLVQQDILHQLGLTDAERIVMGFNRPNLMFEVLPVRDSTAKLRLTRDFLGNAKGAGIIYAGTRRDAEEVAEFARQVVGVEADYYHAGMEAGARAQVQDAFMEGDLPLVVATNAFGMGIDRADVRYVLHYSMPGTLEAYYQEAGRAGRDGLPSRATLLYSSQDASLQSYFIETNLPSAADLRKVHEFVSRSPQATYEMLENATGLRDTQARVALEQLQASGAIRSRAGDSYGLNFEALPLTEAMLQQIAGQVQARQKHQRSLLAKMIGYAETEACRRRTILDYFGDPGPADAPSCCDNHRARAQTASEPARPAQSEAEQAALTVLETIAALKWRLGKDRVSLILKGSNARNVATLKKARNYGKFAAFPKSKIDSLIEQLLSAGYLKQMGGGRPIISLTERGQAMLKSRVAIPVKLRPLDEGAAMSSLASSALGDSIALTGKLFSQGLTPEQIATKRGFTNTTIYSHLAQLIAQGSVDVNLIVTVATQQLIRGAIEQLGSVQYLAPIKARLPKEISYEAIRCVASAWLREHGTSIRVDPLAKVPPASSVLRDLPLQPLRDWRRATATALGLPEYHLLSDETLRRVARERPQSSSQLYAFTGLSTEVVEKYGDEIITVIQNPSTEVIDAILEFVRSKPGQLPRSGVAKLLVGSRSTRVDMFHSHPLYNRFPGRSRIDVTLQVDALIEAGLLEQGEKGYLLPTNRMEMIASSSPGSRQDVDSPSHPVTPSPTADPVADFLARPHPRTLQGPWLAGWALDFHSRFDGDTQNRSMVGDLVYRYKYRDERGLADELARRWAQLLAEHPELPAPDLVIPIPPSTPREFDPVSALAQALAAQLKIPVQIDLLTKTRATKPQKEMTSLAQKQANVAGAFALKNSPHGKNILLVDDLFDSGATLTEAARLLMRGGAASLVVLTLTKTIHSDD